MKIVPYLSPCTKLKSKWIKNLNINLTTLNQIEEKVGSSLQDIGTGDHFLSRTPVAQTIRESMNKWDLLKLRSFCKAKDTVVRQKGCLLTGRRSSPTKVSKIYKELKKLDTKTLINPIKKWGADLNRNSQQKNFEWPKDT